MKLRPKKLGYKLRHGTRVDVDYHGIVGIPGEWVYDAETDDYYPQRLGMCMGVVKEDRVEKIVLLPDWWHK